MYRLRHFIEEGVDVDEALSSVKNELGKDLESLMDEALQSKCPEDGQNLLMYAATHGNEAWLVRLVNDMRSRVSTCKQGRVFRVLLRFSASQYLYLADQDSTLSGR